MVRRLYWTVWFKRFICFVALGNRVVYRQSWGMYFKRTCYVIFYRISVDFCCMYTVYEKSDRWLIIYTILLSFVSINKPIKIIQANDRMLCNKVWSKFYSQRWSRRKDWIHISGTTENFVSYLVRANISNTQVKKLYNTQ